MKKGFTLVELSIVLVIIGLLIGGILVAQSLIETAKLGSLTRELSQYDAGVASFYSKFRGLPGDSSLAYARIPPSEKEGLITDNDKINDTLRYAVGGSSEHLLFWLDLARLTSLTPDNCPELATRADPFSGGGGLRVSGSDCNAASTSYGDSSDIAIIAGAFDILAPTSNPSDAILPGHADGNAYYLANCVERTASPPRVTCNASFTQAQALALDAKMDDGVPNSGEVQATTNATFLSFRVNNQTFATSYDISGNNVNLIKKFSANY